MENSDRMAGTGKDGAAPLAVAINGVTDYTVVLAGEETDEVCLSLQWLARRLQLAGVGIQIKDSAPEAGRFITAAVDGEMPEDWTVTFDPAGNITVTGRDDRRVTLGLTELGAVLAPDAHGNIMISDTATVVGNSTPYDREGWTLAVPAIIGGRLSKKAYEIGSGLENDNRQACRSSGRMMLVDGVSVQDFGEYGARLAAYGYTCDSESVRKAPDGEGRYAQYVRGLSVVYVYYSPADRAIRIVEDRASVRVRDFAYTFAHTADTPTDVVLYGLKMHPQGINADEPGGDPTVHNCGALLMIAQADGSLFVIDGGSRLQATEAAVEGLWRYMHEITGTPMGHPLRIACWFMSHPHSDHYAMVAALLRCHREEIVLERAMFNFQNAPSAGHGVHDDMRKCIRDSYPDVRYLKCHSGQSIRLGSLTVDVMGTHEDAVDPATGVSTVRDSNSMTTVLRVTLADGTRVMILGDVTEEREAPTMRAYAAEELACDVVQVAHHSWNAMPHLYKAIGAPYVLWPQYEPSRFTGAHYIWAQNVKAQVLAGGAEHFYYAGLHTARLTWRNGKVTVTLSDVVC